MAGLIWWLSQEFYHLLVLRDFLRIILAFHFDSFWTLCQNKSLKKIYMYLTPFLIFIMISFAIILKKFCFFKVVLLQHYNFFGFYIILFLKEHTININISPKSRQLPCQLSRLAANRADDGTRHMRRKQWSK